MLRGVSINCYPRSALRRGLPGFCATANRSSSWCHDEQGRGVSAWSTARRRPASRTRRPLPDGGSSEDDRVQEVALRARARAGARTYTARRCADRDDAAGDVEHDANGLRPGSRRALRNERRRARVATAPERAEREERAPVVASRRRHRRGDRVWLARGGVKGWSFSNASVGRRGSTARRRAGPRQFDAHQRAISKLAIEHYERFAEEMETDPCSSSGYLFTIADRSAGSPSGAGRDAARSGVEVAPWTEKARRIVPELRSDDLVGATFGRRDGLGNPHEITRRWSRRRNARRAVRVRVRGRIESIAPRNGAHRERDPIAADGRHAPARTQPVARWAG